MASETPNSTPLDRRRFLLRLPRPLWIGLAGFVLLLGAIGLGFGLPIYRQQVAKVALQQRGAYIESDYHGPKWLGKRPTKIDGRDEEWERNPLRKLFYDVKYVDFSLSELGDDDLQLLHAMPKLQRLSLKFSAVTDAGLGFLRGLNQLESLDLGYTEIRGGGLAEIIDLPELRSLRLDGVELTDADLSGLPQFKNLKTLSLDASHISDVGLERIASISTLQRLNLGNIDEKLITDTGFRYLKGMKSLQKVYFTIDELTHVSPDGSTREWTLQPKVLDVPRKEIRTADGDEFHDAFNEDLAPEFDE